MWRPLSLAGQSAWSQMQSAADQPVWSQMQSPLQQAVLSRLAPRLGKGLPLSALAWVQQVPSLTWAQAFHNNSDETRHRLQAVSLDTAGNHDVSTWTCYSPLSVFF